MSGDLPLRCVVVPVTPFAQNASVVWASATGKGAFVDPGGDTERLREAARANGVTIEKILVTHGHLDHAGAVADLAAELDVPVEGPHRDDIVWIDQLADQGARYGMGWCKPFRPDRWLEHGDRVTVGDEALDVIHCPGHTPGHVVFHHPKARVAFVGDVLFRGSIGRTDFPHGNHADLIRSITGRLWPLGGDVTFVPGHGPLSTFGDERRANPYVADRVLKYSS